MDHSEDSPNIIDAILAPTGKGPGIVPSKDTTTEQVLSSAAAIVELNTAIKSPAPQGDPNWRRSMAGQNRVNPAAGTEIALRMLQKSPRLVKQVKIEPVSVDNLLLFETGLGALRRGCWPLLLFARLRVRKTGAQVDQVLSEIRTIAAQPEHGRLATALGQAEQAQGRVERSDQARIDDKKRQRAEADKAAEDKRKGIAGKRAMHQLVSDASGGAKPPSPPPAPAGKSGKAHKGHKAPAGTSPTGRAPKGRKGRKPGA